MRAIGLDGHLDFCEVAIVEAGVVRSSGRVATTPEALELFAGSLGPDDRVALEVTGNAWEIARIIEPHVARVVVVSPGDTGIRQARAKTDRLDARALAKLLASGELDAGLGARPGHLGDAPAPLASRSARPCALARRVSRSPWNFGGGLLCELSQAVEMATSGAGVSVVV